MGSRGEHILKWCFIAQSPSCSHFHRSDMAELLLKWTKSSKPSIYMTVCYASYSAMCRDQGHISLLRYWQESGWNAWMDILFTITQTVSALPSSRVKGLLHYRSWYIGLSYRVPMEPNVRFKVRRSFILVRLKVNLRWTYIKNEYVNANTYPSIFTYVQKHSWVWLSVKVYLLLHTYVSENFLSRECKVNLLNMCIFAHLVVVIDASAFHSTTATAYLNKYAGRWWSVYSQNVYCAKMSIVPKCLFPKCLLCKNV